ncbi:MAG: HEPN domain-containing protein [Cyclobacteriaceae bacterium]|nr:HEPN domain-containing protein [Cyclobacteriaceae bacterium]
MDRIEKVKYWLDLAEYDLETAYAMLESKRYLYVGFMCHQTIEKIFKAYYSSKYDKTPPYTHNLKILANKAEIYEALSEDQKDVIDTLLPLNIEARYPTYKEQILRILSYAKCISLIEQTKSLTEWIKKQL